MSNEGAEALTRFEQMLENLFEQGTHLGITIIKAIIILIVGKLLINLVNRLLKRIMTKRDVDLSVQSFLGSLINVTLIILLIISVIGTLGIQTTSFAALLASAGVAIGIALSGNLSNFAGGIIILLFKPFKVGDYINAQGVGGTVLSIQIFHTILTTSDNIRQYIPNGTLSSGVISNYNVNRRLVEWIIGVDYGSNYEEVKAVVLEILSDELRLIPTPQPFIALHKLDSSSVNIVVRVWVKASDYWDVYFDINKKIYETFNAKGINFPFPQMTIHKGR